MNKRKLQNKRLNAQIEAMQLALSDSDELDEIKREAKPHLNQMQSSIKASEADEDKEQDRMIALLENMQKRIQNLEKKAEGYKQKLIDQRVNMMSDSLTKLPNRMAYEERVDSEFAKAQAGYEEICMALIDIDHFKRINDQYGHTVGDKTLQIIASQLKKNLHSSDFIARWGGEEFVALLPKSDIDSAYARVDTMREKIAKLPFMFKGERVSVTISIGLISLNDWPSTQVAFENVDKLLYQAKQSGRNQTAK